MWAWLADRLETLGRRSWGRARRASTARSARPHVAGADLAQRLRVDRARYLLGRARRARDAGRLEAGAREARRVLALTPANPWALAVLGQCLLRQAEPDLVGARRATERAWALDPTNGYFVRLLLDVLDAQGDVVGRAELLDWAWWRGAPVERWLPDGMPSLARLPVVADGHSASGSSEALSPSAVASPPLDRPLTATVSS